MGRGEKSLLHDPGTELRLRGREKRRAKIINGMEDEKKRTMPNAPMHDVITMLPLLDTIR